MIHYRKHLSSGWERDTKCLWRSFPARGFTCAQVLPTLVFESYLLYVSHLAAVCAKCLTSLQLPKYIPRGIIDSMDMSFSRHWELVVDRGAWHVAVHAVAESDCWVTELKWTELIQRTSDKFVWPPEIRDGAWSWAEHSNLVNQLLLTSWWWWDRAVSWVRQRLRERRPAQGVFCYRSPTKLPHCSSFLSASTSTGALMHYDKECELV